MLAQSKFCWTQINIQGGFCSEIQIKMLIIFFTYTVAGKVEEDGGKKAVHLSDGLLFQAQCWLAANSGSKCSMPMHIHMFNIQTCIPNDAGEARMQ